jgi:hypothetical protein
MSAAAGPLQRIFRRFGPWYTARFAQRMPQRHRRAVLAIGACRTEALGGHTELCCRCGTSRFVPRACRHALCPACHTAELDRWLAARADQLLPVPYFHLTFPLPAELREAARKNYSVVCAAMLRAAAEALQSLAVDRLGGKLGIMAVVHTWGRTLCWHPHVHCLVPGIVVRSDGSFRRLDAGFLLPVRALSEVYRATFLRLVRSQPAAPALPPILWSKRWIANCRPCAEGPANVLRYLGRYTKRGPLPESKIVSTSDQRIVFGYVSHRTGLPATCTLSPQEFLRRYLQHTPPVGFHRIRYYGFLAPGARRLLRALRSALLPGLVALQPIITELCERHRGRTPYRCPQCGGSDFVRIAFLPPNPRAPPPEQVA